MKNIMIRSGLLLIAILLICFGIYAQDTTVIDTIVTPGPSGPGITLPLIQEWFAKGMGPLMSAIVILFGYLSKWVPLFNKIDDATFRIFAFAVLTGAGFVYFGADIWQVAMSYFGATSMYELIFKKIFGGSARTDGEPRTKSILAQ